MEYPLPAKITQLNLVGSWELNLKSKVCAICREDLHLKCLACQDKNGKYQECDLVTGICSHTYHQHCINTWLKSRPVCPTDNKDWIIAKH